jgi:hypothetical protein
LTLPDFLCYKTPGTRKLFLPGGGFGGISDLSTDDDATERGAQRTEEHLGVSDSEHYKGGKASLWSSWNVEKVAHLETESGDSGI